MTISKRSENKKINLKQKKLIFLNVFFKKNKQTYFQTVGLMNLSVNYE